MIAKLAVSALCLLGMCSCTSTAPAPSTANTPSSPQAFEKSSPPFFIAFPEESNAPVVAVDVVRWSIDFPEPQLIADLWADGRIIWSRSPVKGGPPYHKGRYDPARLNSLMDYWEREGVLRQNEWGFAVPDAALTNIEITHGARHSPSFPPTNSCLPTQFPTVGDGFTTCGQRYGRTRGRLSLKLESYMRERSRIIDETPRPALNQSRQPMPGGRLGVFPALSAWRGCARSWPL
jgi:hypothetical protein